MLEYNRRIFFFRFKKRSSHRLRSQEIKERRNLELQKIVADSEKDKFIIKNFDVKGRGILNIIPYKKGDFVVQYKGDLLIAKEARKRLEFYKDNAPQAECYMYYFSHNDKQFCIDASKERPHEHGRLINHSRKKANCIMKKVIFDNTPQLLLFAQVDIEAMSELLYDYGDMSGKSITECPWLKE